MRTVGIFVDFENLLNSLRQYSPDSHPVEVVVKILGLFVDRDIRVRMAYSDWTGSSTLAHQLQRAGVTPSLVLRKGNEDRSDIVMSLDILEISLAGKVEECVLVTGDGDFYDVCNRLRRHGCTITVVSLSKTLSSELKMMAHNVISLDTMVEMIVEQENEEDKLLDQLIDLVAWGEGHLPFVGLGYLINTLINERNLGRVLKTTSERDAFVRKAIESGILIEKPATYQGKNTTKVFLNKTHPKVIRVAEAITKEVFSGEDEPVEEKKEKPGEDSVG